MSNKIQWSVGIDGAENGFIVSVGCKRFVFEERSKLLDELDAYLSGKETPLSVQVKKEMECEPQCVAPPPQNIGGGAPMARC